MKVWNGSSWINPTALKVWNGSSWVSATGKIWNGSSWVTFFSPVTFSPVGSLIFNERPTLEDVATETTAQITITASSSVTWNWTGSGGSVGFPATVSVVNGGSASSIQFSLPWNGNFTTSAAFEVEAANRYWRVELQMETYD